jgi:DNA-directed RNA polymerase specialized sigma24 family protein
LILNISSENLAVRLHRARLLLRQCLESKYFGRPATTVRPAGGSP